MPNNVFDGSVTAFDGPLGVGEYDAADNIDQIHTDTDIGTGDANDRVIMIFVDHTGTLRYVYFDDSVGALAVK